MADNKFMRKKLIVDKKFQVSFITVVLIALIIVVILISILMIYSTSQKITGSVYTKIVDLKNTKEIIIPVVLKIGIFILLVVGGFSLYQLLKYTHRIVGPLVRFKRILKGMGDGDFSEQITFRGKDKLKDLGDILSQTIFKLNNRIKTLKKHFNVIEMLMEEKETMKIDKKEMKRVKDSVQNIKSILNKFKTD